MQRGQFTFYRSFYEALHTIEDDIQRAKAYDVLTEYALNNTLPDLDSLPGPIKMAFILIRPTLDTGRNKAANRLNKTKTNQEQIDKEKESECKIESECKTEKEKENKGIPKMFERFWLAYPKKVGREEAYRVFCEEKVPLSTLLPALERQKVSPQWLKEGGRYIPNPATWLKDRRWQSDTNTPYRLGTYEIEAINRILKNPSTPT